MPETMVPAAPEQGLTGGAECPSMRLKTVVSGTPGHSSGEEPETRQVAQPLNVTGAFHQDFLFYPYRLKRVVVADGVALTRYETQVLRSDGVSLGFGYKPAPRGTPAEDRVLALGDGTELSRAPRPKRHRSSRLVWLASRGLTWRGLGGGAPSARPL
ncbi:hypothetical protein BH24DEI2_BH24DEI2_27580 [soil metagenome]